MLQINRILLALDFSPSSRAAIPNALEMANRFQAELHVLHAKVLRRDPDSEDEGVTSEEDVIKKLKSEFSDDLFQKYGFDRSDINLQFTSDRSVAAAPPILNYAADHKIDLVVMGTHGRRGARRFFIGSVTEEVVRMAPCPVLTIREREGDPKPDYNSILVPVDFSGHAKRAVQHGRELASTYNATLELFHVIEESLHPAFYGPTVQSISDAQPNIEEKTVEHLQDFYEEAGGTDVDTSFSVKQGHAGKVIPEYAEEQNTGLILMPTHGRTGLEHFMMGSVAERVVRRATCPVLTLKSFNRSLLPDT